MGQRCAAKRCKIERNADSRQKGITFHKFPIDPAKRTKWELALKRDGFTATKFSALCSRHFETEMFDRTGQTVRLRDGATPTIFDHNKHPKKAKRRTTKNSQKTEPPPPQLYPSIIQIAQNVQKELEKKEAKEKVERIKKDHAYALSSLKDLKTNYWMMQQRVEDLEKKLRNATKKGERSKKSLTKALDSLKEQNLLTDDLQSRLEGFSDIPMDLFKKPAQAYSEDQKDFALTLHTYGPKAYSFLRDEIKLPLPHLHTLQKFRARYDREQETLEAVNSLAEESPVPPTSTSENNLCDPAVGYTGEVVCMPDCFSNAISLDPVHASHLDQPMPDDFENMKNL